MLEFDGKSEDELLDIINSAKSQLSARISEKREQVIAQIKELAASINVSVEIIDATVKTKASRNPQVAPKYRNPANATQTWTGRGVAPKWMKELLGAGRSKEEFLI